MSPSPRERDCGILCVEHVDEHPSIVVKREEGGPRARWKGILTCGHIWTCPVCSQNLRSERAERITRAVDHLAGRWQMLTVTFRHRHGLALKDLVEGLGRAWRRTRQGGRIQRVWTGRVSASVRCLEVTYGDNGWHPHVHVLLRTTDWTEEEKGWLQDRWERAVVKELGVHARPSDLVGLKWSEPFDAKGASGRRATYLAKLGLETSGIAKEGKGSSRTPWDLARAAAAGDSRSLWLWREFYAATRGKRAIELDDRAAAADKRAQEVASSLLENEPEGNELPVHIEVQRDDVRALRRLERRIGAIMAIVLRAAEERGAEGVREWVDFARADLLARAGPRESPARAPPWLPARVA